MTSTECIFLDIDGVLNMMPFDALSLIAGRHIIEYPLPGDYDIVKACNTLLTGVILPSHFWGRLNRSFWTSIPKSSECDWLIKLCAQMVGQKNVYLLTATTTPDAAAGKIEWIHKNTPDWLHNQFIISSHKGLCARPNALLIDDYDKNVQEFKAAGGQTILVPRPWNSKHAMCGMFNLSQLQGV